MKEKFLEYCLKYKDELVDRQKFIDENESDNLCTLAELGLNYSYELANIGFELGYASWLFEKRNFDDEDYIKKSFKNTIISNETIEGLYTTDELEEITKKIMKSCKN